MSKLVKIETYVLVEDDVDVHELEMKVSSYLEHGENEPYGVQYDISGMNVTVES